MISINRWATQASNKLEEGKKNVSGQKEKAMAPAVAAQLKVFCEQNEEFARAVAIGGTFTDCMKKVASGVGHSISDLDAYKKAVQFYFPGAEVEMSMRINIGGEMSEKSNAKRWNDPGEENTKVIELVFDSFFD